MQLTFAIVGAGAALTAAVSLHLYYSKQLSKLQDDLVESLRAKQHAEELCEQERIGRTRAQRRLNDKLDVVSLSGMEPIGYLESVYRRRFGTPRQGAVVTRGRATLRLRPDVNPRYSTENMEEFSHVWLIYIFHENTNALRRVSDKPKAIVKSKVKPPRLGGESVGLFSTRTPHRPNPIGLSLVKLDKVVDGVLYLSGIDVCNKTPILDVKPYLPYSDSVPLETTRVAAWVDRPVVSPMSNVTIDDEAMARLPSIVPQLQFYETAEEFIDAVKEVLSHDIRSENMRSSTHWRYEVCRFRFDNTRIAFVVDQEKKCKVVDFEYFVDSEKDDDDDIQVDDKEDKEEQQDAASAKANPEQNTNTRKQRKKPQKQQQ